MAYLLSALGLRGGRGRGRSTYHYHYHSGDDGKSAFSLRGVRSERKLNRVKLQHLSEAFKGRVVGGGWHIDEQDDGKSAFGVSEVAEHKRSFQRGWSGGMAVGPVGMTERAPSA